MSDGLQLPLGEVIAWQSNGAAHAEVVRALVDAGIDPRFARDMLPRNAFSRACRELSDERIIRTIGEDNTHIEFQFTKESRIGKEFEYLKEANLRLRKSDGAIECAVESLQKAAQGAFEDAMVNRTASDVSTIVQRIIEQESDLFPIRPQGGCYFVPQRGRALIDSVQRFLGGIGGTVVRFSVAQGNVESERSVKVSVAEGLMKVLAEYEAAVADFDKDTRPDTIKRAAERIRNAQFKVEAYAALLGDERGKLEKALKDSKEKLRAKVAELGKVMPKEKEGGGGAGPAPVPAVKLTGHAARSIFDIDPV